MNQKSIISLRAVASILLASLFLQNPFTVSAKPPAGFKAMPFYDHASIQWPGAKLVFIEEVPGLLQHFYVVDMRGFLVGLYPKGQGYEKVAIADITGRTDFLMQGEQGAFGIAFHPKFVENGLFYWILRLKAGDGKPKRLAIEEWKAEGSKRENAKFVRTIHWGEHKGSFGVGCVQFGIDGMLYVSTSDYNEDSWNLKTEKRKVLRIDIGSKDPGKEYAVPKDNPFYNDPDQSIPKEIWAYGFRNPWSFQIDPKSGNLWLGDVGQGEFEDFHKVQKGKNHGWGDGGDGAPRYTHGFSGACKTAAGQPGRYDCEKFQDPEFAFAHTGFNGRPFTCIIAGPTWYGAKESPFYGYTFVADMHQDYLVAYKDGEGPTVVGDFAVQGGNKGLRNGITHIGRDSYYNLYATFCDFFGNQQIYKLVHPELTALTEPASVVWEREKSRAKLSVLMARPLAKAMRVDGKRLDGLKTPLLWQGSSKQSLPVAKP